MTTLTNPHRGYITIEIGDKEYALRLNFNAIAKADQMLGQSCLNALGTGRFDAIQSVLAAGLQNPQNPRNSTKAIRQLDPAKLEYYVDKIGDALEASGVIKSDDTEENGDKDEEYDDDDFMGENMAP